MKSKIILFGAVPAIVLILSFVSAVSPNIDWVAPSNNSFTSNQSWIYWNVSVNEVPNACLLNVNNSLCYQSTANVSTSCGGLNSGDYSWNGSWNPSYPVGNAFDGDWSSLAGATASQIAYFWINLSKPTNAQRSTSKFMYKIGDFESNAIFNYTINSTCWNAYGGTGNITIMVIQNHENGWADWYCYNGLTNTELTYDLQNWKNFKHSSLGVFDTGMWWDINNVSMAYASGHCIYNSTSLTNQITYCAKVYANDSSGNINVSSVQCATVNLSQSGGDTSPPSPAFVGLTLANLSYTANNSWIFMNVSAGESLDKCLLDITPHATLSNLSTPYEIDGYEMTYYLASGTVDTDTEHGYLGRFGDGGVFAYERAAIPISTSAITANVTNATFYFDTFDPTCVTTTNFTIYVYTNASFNLNDTYCRANATSKLECWNKTELGGSLIKTITTTNCIDNYSVDITSYLNLDHADGLMNIWLKSNRENNSAWDDIYTTVVDTPDGYIPYINYSLIGYENISMTMASGSRSCWYNATNLWNNTAYYFRVWANDTAGNMNVSEDRQITVNLTQAPPTFNIAIISPANATYSTGPIWLNYSLSASCPWCEYSLNGGTNQTILKSGPTTSLVLGGSCTALGYCRGLYYNGSDFITTNRVTNQIIGFNPAGNATSACTMSSVYNPGAIDGNGTAFVVLDITPSGDPHVIKIVDTSCSEYHSFNVPDGTFGVATNDTGNINNVWVADYGNAKILHYTAAGVNVNNISISDCFGPYSLDIKDNEFYVQCINEGAIGAIRRYNTSGSLAAIYNVTEYGLMATYHNLYDIDVINQSFFYQMDGSNNNVYPIAADCQTNATITPIIGQNNIAFYGDSGAIKNSSVVYFSYYSFGDITVKANATGYMNYTFSSVPSGIEAFNITLADMTSMGNISINYTLTGNLSNASLFTVAYGSNPTVFQNGTSVNNLVTITMNATAPSGAYTGWINWTNMNSTGNNGAILVTATISALAADIDIINTSFSVSFEAGGSSIKYFTIWNKGTYTASNCTMSYVSSVGNVAFDMANFQVTNTSNVTVMATWTGSSAAVDDSAQIAIICNATVLGGLDIDTVDGLVIITGGGGGGGGGGTVIITQNTTGFISGDGVCESAKGENLINSPADCQLSMARESANVATIAIILLVAGAIYIIAKSEKNRSRKISLFS